MKKVVLSCAVLLFGLTGGAVSQSLTVNGLTGHVQVPTQTTIQLQLTGAANQPHFWLFNLDPGPSTLAGEPLPIGLGPGLLDLGMGTPLPASGVRTISFPVPDDPTITGIDFYSVGGVIDPGAPAGFTVSNGVSFVFTVGGVTAGPDAATRLNEAVTLDGSGNRDPFTGALPPGTTLQWNVIDGPAGAQTTLVGEPGEFPAFSADTPGLYTLELELQGPGGYGTDLVTVSVYDLHFNAPVGGVFTGGLTLLTGELAGPPHAAFTVAGQPVVPFGGVFFVFPPAPTEVMESVVARVTTPSGAYVEAAVVQIDGTPAPLGQPVFESSTVRLRDAGVSGLEPDLETALAALPFNQIVQGLPPITAINGAPALSAVVTTQGGSFNTTDIDVDFWPTPTHVGVSLTLRDVTVSVNVGGELIFVNYNEPASIFASTAVLTAEMLIHPATSGGVSVSFQNLNASLSGFNFTLSSWLLNNIASLSAIQNAIRDQVEAALESLDSQLPSYVNPLLDGLVPSLDLTASGIPLQVDFPFNSVHYDADGVSTVNNFQATALTLGPDAPDLTRYLESAHTLPVYGSQTSTLGVPYGFAIGMSENLLNQLLAELVRSGALDLDLTGTLGEAPNTLTLSAGVLALLLPAVGFEGFDFNAPVTMEVRHTTAPCVEFTPQGTDMAKLHLGDMLVDIVAEPSPGVRLPVLSVGVSGSVDMSMAVDPQNTTVNFIIGSNIAVTTNVRKAFAGTDPSLALSGLPTILQLLLPMLTGPITQIPIPALPFGNLSVLEVSGTVAHPDFLSAYFFL